METSFFGKMKSTVLIMAVMNQYAAERMYVRAVYTVDQLSALRAHEALYGQCDSPLPWVA